MPQRLSLVRSLPVAVALPDDFEPCVEPQIADEEEDTESGIGFPRRVGNPPGAVSARMQRMREKWPGPR